MSETKRMIDGEAGAFARSLLRSARRDAPAVGSREAALAALGLVSAGGPQSASRARVWKWVVTGVVGIAGVAAALRFAPAIEGVEAPRSARASAARTARAGETFYPVHRSAASDTPALTTSTTTPTPTSTPTSTSTAPNSASDDLSSELALLDAARSALVARDVARALALLDDHDHRFPRGALGQEAVVLRIQALVASGDREGARALADRFLAANPSSPHAARVRELVSP